MRRVGAWATLWAVALLAGCAGGGATLELAGEGGGERTRALACDGEGGIADARLLLAAHTTAGLVSLLVRDGLGEEVLQRHVAVGSGRIDQESVLSGAPGTWTLEERRTDDFRGEFRAELICGA